MLTSECSRRCRDISAEFRLQAHCERLRRSGSNIVERKASRLHGAARSDIARCNQYPEGSDVIVPSQSANQPKGAGSIASAAVRLVGFVARVAEGADDGRVVGEAQVNAADPLAGAAEMDREATLGSGRKKLGGGLARLSIILGEHSDEAYLDQVISEQGRRRPGRRQFK